MYNGATYPLYCEGSGYVLSRLAAECIYQESLKIPYFYIEVFLLSLSKLFFGVISIRPQRIRSNLELWYYS